MHLENASSPDPKAPGAVEPDLIAPPPVVVRDRELVAALDREVEVVTAVLAAVDVAVVVLLTDATLLGLFAAPPQPATRPPLTSAAAASARTRCKGVSRATTRCRIMAVRV
jgi:hypothetical protein